MARPPYEALREKLLPKLSGSLVRFTVPVSLLECRMRQVSGDREAARAAKLRSVVIAAAFPKFEK